MVIPSNLERSHLDKLSENGADFQVDVTSDLASLTVRAERGPQGDRYHTTVQLDPERVQAGVIRGTITIRTNDSQFPELRNNRADPR